MNKKVIVFYSSQAQKGIVQGLVSAGYIVDEYYYGLNLNSGLKKLITKYILNRHKLVVKKFNNKIKELFENFSSSETEFILFMKGHQLTSYSINKLSEIKCKKIQWTIDSVERFPGQSSLFNYMDAVFLQDGSDVHLHPKGVWLPLGYDSNLFKFNKEKSIDILMIGNLTQPFYNTRVRYFYEAAGLARKGYKVEFVGSNVPAHLMSHFKHCGVTIYSSMPFKEYACKISSSKICINIHQDDGGKAINPLFFAIPSTGTIQITNKLYYLSDWLCPDEDFFWADLDYLNFLIEEKLSSFNIMNQYLSSKKLRNHSYLGRASFILTYIQDL